MRVGAHAEARPKLGRIEAVEEVEDPMLARASHSGREHEARALANYKHHVADGVVEIETEDARADPVILEEPSERTIEALEQGKDVVFQATFFDEPGDSRHRVRRVRRLPRMQRRRVPGVGYQTRSQSSRHRTAAAWRRTPTSCGKLGIPVSDDTYLLLGSGEESRHALNDIEPVFHDRVARLMQMIEARLDDPNPIEWGAPGYTADGRCEWCPPEVERTRDVLLVAGMRTTTRADWRMPASSPSTTWQPAAAPSRGSATRRSRSAGSGSDATAAPLAGADEPHEVLYEVASPGALAQLPRRMPGISSSTSKGIRCGRPTGSTGGSTTCGVS